MRYVREINGELEFFPGTLSIPGTPPPDAPDMRAEDLVVLNPTHEMIIEAGWAIYDDPEVTPQPTAITPGPSLEEQITDLQLAMCEIYEMIGGGLIG